MDPHIAAATHGHADGQPAAERQQVSPTSDRDVALDVSTAFLFASIVLTMCAVSLIAVSFTVQSR